MSVFTNNAIEILEDRYLLKDKNGVLIEAPDELIQRVSNFVSSCEKHQKAFQIHTDNWVSKTINLPENTAISNISEIFFTTRRYQLKA